MASQNSGRLQGKVAIVTGGGSGFGEAIAKKFVSEGCKVIITDINDENGQRVAASVEGGLSYVRADVTKAGDWKSLLEGAWREYGRVDVLVNNAGISYRNKPTAEVTEDEFDRVFNVNVKSIFLATQALMPKLIEQKQGGNMINIASIGAVRPRPGLVWYNASKGAVHNATKGLAAEYGPHGIRINSVCPLLTATALFETFVGVPPTEENKKSFTSNVPLGRIGHVDDVANACLFLASEESSFITGTCMEVDGGKGI